MQYAGGIGETFEGRMRPFIGYRSPQELIQVFTPSDRYGGGTQGIFHDQGPTDDPGHELTHGYIRVGIGASGDGDHGSEFGIAESGERTSDGGYDEREGYGWTCGLSRGRSRAHKQSGADDGTDPEGDEVSGAEGSFQSFLTIRCVCEHLVERFFGK